MSNLSRCLTMVSFMVRALSRVTASRMLQIRLHIINHHISKSQ
jgi:hypothetical protein